MPDSSDWMGLLERERHLVFHEPVWAQVLQDEYRRAPICCVFECDGHVVSGFLGIVLRVAGVKLLEISYPYGGIVGAPPPGDALETMMDAIARETGASRTRIVSFPGMAALEADGFVVTELQSRVVPLKGRSEEDVFQRFDKKLRWEVRKSRESGAVVESERSPDAIRDFYSLYLESMRRNEAAAKYRPSLIESICGRLGALERAHLLIARLEGQAIAGILVVDSKTSSHYLMAGADAAFLRLHPNHLLLDRAIQDACKSGMEEFDMLPSGVGNESLEKFKSKWGAEPVAAPVYTKIMRPMVMRLWNGAYQLANTKLGSLSVRALRRLRG